MINFEEDKIITAYSFDENNVYCGSFQYHWAHGTGLAANSTDIEPPEFSEGFIPVFINGKWEVKPDNRGKTVYSTIDQSEIKIDYVGEIKDGSTELKPASIFDIWNGTAWIDPRPQEEIETYRLSQFPALKRRQFMRVLVLNGFNLDQIESEINKIPGTQTRQLALIDWKDATEFWRTDETLLMVADLLGLDAARIDAMWEQAKAF